LAPPPPIPGLRLHELLGEGVTGSVYAAVNANGDELAVKFLHEALGDQPGMVARFRREAENAEKLRSDFIAEVVGAGRSGRRYWIAYRRLHGETLASRLRRERVLPPAALATFIDQILRGLDVAHAAGVVHRDIKPGNIMIERPRGTRVAERACILDFGVSKGEAGRGHGGSQDGLTSATATLGTVSYMAPEQVEGSASVDHRADLYAAAVVAYRALSGRMPHSGALQAAVMHAKVNTDARSLQAVTRVTWPRLIEDFFEQALAREPGGRFATAAAMATAWGHVLQDQGLPAVDVLREAGAAADDDDEGTVLEGPGKAR
jgi:serine/threonine-protein kinase